MISEEKIKIMTEIARYEKNHGNEDSRVNRYTEADYKRLESIKMSIAVTMAFLGCVGMLVLSKLDVVIVMIRENHFILPMIGVLIAYAVILMTYLHFTKKRALEKYHEVEARMKIYNSRLEELLQFYEIKEQEDVSPTIGELEEDNGKTINI